MTKKMMLCFLLFIGGSFFILQNVTFNFLLLWSWLPLALGFFVWVYASNSHRQLRQKTYGAYGFLLSSIAFSYFYHFAWYFDWDGTRSSGATTSLIFMFAPIYAVIVGIGGYLVGYILISYIGRHRSGTRS